MIRFIILQWLEQEEGTMIEERPTRRTEVLHQGPLPNRLQKRQDDGEELPEE
jgi:hypothetical protein